MTAPDRIVRSRRGWTAGVVPIGFALVLLGAWAIFAPLTGPYFGYGFDTHTTWLASNRQWELDIGPGILVWLGGAFLLVPPRPRAWLAALLAAIGGIWLIVGPSIHPLWGTAFFPFGSTSARGFRVDGPGGALGRLSRPRYGDGGSLEAIVVSTGVLRRRQLTVPYEDVEWILPRVRRVLLQTQTAAGSTRTEDGDKARA